MTELTIRQIVDKVVARTDEFGYDEGSAWLGHYNPDEAYLKCGELVDAICEALEATHD